MGVAREETGSFRQLRILTWHVHGSYLYYLSQVPHEFYVPVRPGRPEGYGGRAPGFPWPDNLTEVPSGRVKRMGFDCILYQSRRNYLVDQHEILSDRQRRLPKIYLEHDPPRENPTDTRHVFNDTAGLLVHVTHFNDLMWDSGEVPTSVIDHGVMVPDDASYDGELERGIAVVNGLGKRGRRLGVDVLARVREQIPIDLAGMESAEFGGLGEIGHFDLPRFESRYRFFFNPIRYTSLGLAVCEAMTIGMPILGLATTEMVSAVKNGVNGWVETDVEKLIGRMRELLDDPNEARRLGEGARSYARERFSIERFVADWREAFALAVGGERPRSTVRSAEAGLAGQAASASSLGERRAS